MNESEEPVFVLSRNDGNGLTQFNLHEPYWYEYGRVTSVRACLQEHRTVLVARLAALDEILRCDGPETAERFLLDQAHVRVNEVALRAPRSEDRMKTLVRQALSFLTTGREGVIGPRE